MRRQVHAHQHDLVCQTHPDEKEREVDEQLDKNTFLSNLMGSGKGLTHILAVLSRGARGATGTHGSLQRGTTHK